LAPEIRLKIADLSSDQLLGPNEKGEICIASPSMMLGYYRGDCTAAFDNNRYLKTGDVGYYDEEGCLYVTDRIKEIFQYQSWHIVPSCIEAVLMEHPAVKDAAVFGIPHGRMGKYRQLVSWWIAVILLAPRSWTSLWTTGWQRWKS
jgi:4-coumarate--CoA ligase